MAGFLDSKERVVDMVLTDYGRKLYSKGKLRFVYYAFSDDEIDYDPWITNSAYISGTLDGPDLTGSIVEQIQTQHVFEAVTGMAFGKDKDCKDTVCIKNLLFTMPQGQNILPEMEMIPEVESGSLGSKQRKLQKQYTGKGKVGLSTLESIHPIDEGIETFRNNKLFLDLNLKDYFDNNATEGFLIRVYESGSDGLKEIYHHRDMGNIISYLRDVRLFNDNSITILNKEIQKEAEDLDKSVGISTDTGKNPRTVPIAGTISTIGKDKKLK